MKYTSIKSIDISSLYKKEPKKHDELSAFHWFSKAIELDYDSLSVMERPDFVIEIESKKIGIEITAAVRKSIDNDFTTHQIESAQRNFSEKTLQCIEPKLPLDVGLIFENDVAVDKKMSKQAIKTLVPLINQISENMVPHSVELLVRSEEDLFSNNHKKHICPEIPNFLQYIQLLNDGHKVSIVNGTRGGFLDDFMEEDLISILEKKHKALVGYEKFDEHWLVIFSGLVPPLFVEHESPPNILSSSMAASFSGVNFTSPVNTNFDRVYFFKSPAEAILLS